MAADHTAPALQSSLWYRLRESSGVDSPPLRLVQVDGQEDSPTRRRTQLKFLQKIREEIQRNLLLMLTTRQSNEPNLDASAKRPPLSVLQFGLPDLSGSTTSGMDLQKTGAMIRDRVEVFEPRLHAASINVQCELSSHPDALVVRIAGQFGPDDQLQPLLLEATISLSHGEVIDQLAKAG